MKNNENHKDQTEKMKPSHGSQKLLSHIQVMLGKNMKEIMVIYFEYVDSHLFKMAEKAGAHSRQKSYFESLKSIRVHKFNVLTSFLSTLKQTVKLFEDNSFDYFDQKITEAVKKNKTITASIDKSDIEEKLVQNSLIQKFDDIYNEDLGFFKQRFGLLSGSSLELHHIPVCPHVLVSAFAKSIRLLHLDLEIKLVLYKLFESNVLNKLGPVYKKMNKYLHNNGILPGIENQILTDKVTKEIKNNKQKEPVKKLKMKSAKGGTSFIDFNSINDVLLNLQIKIIKDLSSNEAVDITPVDIKKALLIQFKQARFKDKLQILSQPDKDAINLITMMFQLVSGDRNIPFDIKLMLTKLHIPYIKAAIIDQTLLTNKQHPAQVILALISKASIGWSQAKDKGNKFINKVNKAIASIVEQDKLDKSFFSSLLEEYQGFIKEQTNDFKKEQNRVKDKLKGRDRIINAMKTVEALLNHKISNIELPASIKKMLLSSWKNLLVLLLVRHSDTSDEYLVKVNFIDDLIETIQSEQYKVIIRQRIEKLCIEYSEGLVLVAYCGEGLIIKVEEFNQCLLDCHQLDNPSERNQQPSSVVDGEVSESPENSSNIDALKTKIYSQVTDRDLPVEMDLFDEAEVDSQKHILEGLNQKDKDLINKISIGTWFEFKRGGNKKPVKAQLSWSSPKTGMFLFVNTRGLKVVDKMPKELIAGLDDKSITLVDD